MLFKKNSEANAGEAFLYAQFANAFFRDGISPWALYQLPGERGVLFSWGLQVRSVAFFFCVGKS